MLKVKVVEYNKGVYGLWNVDADCPCHYTPYWKTINGAKRYAIKHNFEIIEA